MSNRVSTIANFRNAYENLNKNYYKTSQLNNLIASDNKFSSFSDFNRASDIKYVSDLSKTREEADGYLQNINMAKLKIDTIKVLIDEAIELAHNVKNEIYLSHFASSNTNESQIKKNIEHHAEHLKSIMNAQFGNYYMLSGSKLDNPPVKDVLSNDGNFNNINPNYYQGDDFVSILSLTNNVKITYGINAANAGFAKLVQALNVFYWDLKSDGAATQSINLLDESIRDLIDVNTSLMNNYALCDHYENYWQNARYDVESQYAELENIYHFSFPELFATLNETEVVLEASQAMFNKIVSVNSLDVL